MAPDGLSPTILVAGSRPKGAPDPFDTFCADLGSRLADSGSPIIVGSLRPFTADFHVLKGAGRADVAKVRFIRPVQNVDDVPLEVRLAEFGRFSVHHELHPGNWDDVRSYQVAPADVVVLIGGGVGTRKVAVEAEGHNKVVIPVPHFGGAAEALFNELSGKTPAAHSPHDWMRLRNATNGRDLVSLIRGWWNPPTSQGDYLQRRPGPPEHVGSAAIGIICPLEEELQALLTRIPRQSWRLAPATLEYVQTFYTAQVGEHSLVIASPTQMGRVHAALTTVDLIRKFRPNYVVLTGIAGGNAAQGVALGDVIVAEQIFDYELQKLRPEGPEIRYQVYPAHQRLLAEARALNNPATTIRRHVGPVLSGDKVIALGSSLRSLYGQVPKVKGIEMEGAGCALACLRFDTTPGFLMVRGVSDLADEDKDSTEVAKFRTAACDNAATFTLQLLNRLP